MSRHQHAAHHGIDADYGPYNGAWGDPRNDDSLTECPCCDGDGHRMVLNDENKPERVLCEACDGIGWLHEDGTPAYEPEEH